MRRTLVPLVLLLLPLNLLPACTKREAASPVLLRIDGRSVTLAEFRRDFERSLPRGQAPAPEERAELERSFLVQLIDRRLALAEARRLGIALSPGEAEAAVARHRRDYPGGALEKRLQERGVTLEQWKGELAEGMLVEKVVRGEAYGGVSVSEEEIAAHYREHGDAFDRPAQVRARQIVVAREEEGRAVLESLRRGEDFGALARRLSLSPDREEGGDLGFFARGEMPPGFEAVFELPVGGVSGLVRSDYGYHVFRVEERREARRLKPEEVREEIRAELRARKEEEAYRAWLQALRGRAAIEVNWSLLSG